ncbi:MAG: malate synthase A [Myxococcales bacterium]|nr:malate synthase A [Myxococcales bacterium]
MREIIGPLNSGYEEIFSADALNFIGELGVKYTPRVRELLERRKEIQVRYDRGEYPSFLEDTHGIRAGDWKVADLPQDLLDRRVEITGPVDRKMVINALNSGAKTFMADFEDSNAPTWSNCVTGQINLRDAVRGDIEYVSPDNGKHYKLEPDPAVLIVRPRGWHLFERHMLIDNEAIPAGIFDFGLYFFHNVRALLEKGSGPYFYLPKMQSHLEARLWNDIFTDAQNALGIPQKTIKATVLIETLPASFEMDEILYELRDHSAGLNCGRWDYIFSYIKTFRNHTGMVLPDRSLVSMSQPFMRAYSQLVIKTCHRRGVHAMGGMAAQIPIKGDPEANETALAKVREDKLREAQDGHDGTWVAHPALVSIARSVFDEHMPNANQIDKQRDDVHVAAENLVQVPLGERTEAGLRQNIRVGVQYIAAWIDGNGCVPLYHLMEDAATAEISRTQVWQWVKHGALLSDGRTVTREMVLETLDDELQKLEQELGRERFAKTPFPRAKKLFVDVALSDECVDFLTIPAYEILTKDL